MKDMSLEETFVHGTKGSCTTEPFGTKPLVIRGVTSKTEIDRCTSEGRDYYFIDTGYVGNFPSPGNTSGKKLWHRVVKNKMQHDVIRDVPADRWHRLTAQDPRLLWKGWKDYNQKILLVLPNPKACRAFDIDCDQWISETTEKIKTYSNLPIEIRVKGTRSERGHGYSIYSAFETGVYATVSFNSIASLESVLYGIPAFVSVPCAASPLVSTDLSQLANPFKPSEDLILKQCHSIAYGQYTSAELLDGTAWNIINSYEK